MNIQGYSSLIHQNDSVGVIKENGNNFIIHKVGPGETLYALSRKYNVDVQSIKDANPNSVTSLNVGQKVLIPIHVINNAKDQKYHTVKSSETLFSISRLYNVKVDDIKKWNNLSENDISIGQKIIIKGVTDDQIKAQVTSKSEIVGKTHIVEQSQTMYSISRMYNVSTDQLKKWNSLKSSSLNVGQVLIVSLSTERPDVVQKANSSMLPIAAANEGKMTASQKNETASTSTLGVTPVSTANSIKEVETLKEPSEKMVMKGLAEVIDDTSNTKKYLALHREAPVGTIMQVRNEMNNQSVFVRIVGTIPPTGDNGKVILKISKKAYDRLGAVDNRFPVEISYIP